MGGRYPTPAAPGTFGPGDLVRSNEAGRAYYDDHLDGRGYIVKAKVVAVDVSPDCVAVVVELIDDARSHVFPEIQQRTMYVASGALEPYIPVPQFASLEEADAWLEAHRG